MSNTLQELIATVDDERSFVRFLAALRADSEIEHDRRCRGDYNACAAADHWETRSTTDFLRSAEDWASRGDFADGEHYGEPMLRRIATMLYVGKYLLPQDRPR